MFKDFLNKHGVKSDANFVEYGFGQVEPNHLSAQRTGQIYAQLPADESIDILEQGQFVKYNYGKVTEDGLGRVDFDGIGEWMLVYNETKLYRDNQHDCEFAMIRDNYQARIYSPMAEDTNFDAQSRYYGGKGKVYNEETQTFVDGTFEQVTAKGDYYEPYYNNDPFHIESQYKPQAMPANPMVPRVFKTNVGDIMTTNTIKFKGEDDDITEETPYEDIVALATPGKRLYVGNDGYLTDVEESNSGDMVWQIAKVYTMPDHQPGVKVIRVK